MFARKDLEHDVQIAHQRYCRNLKNPAIQSDSQQPRTCTFPQVVETQVEDAQGSSNIVKSPTSKVDASYTYASVDATRMDAHGAERTVSTLQHEKAEEPMGQVARREDTMAADKTGGKRE